MNNNDNQNNTNQPRFNPQQSQNNDPNSVLDIDKIFQNSVPNTTVTPQQIDQLTAMFSQLSAGGRNN